MNKSLLKMLIISAVIALFMNVGIQTSEAWEINTGDSDKAINKANSWWAQSPGYEWNLHFYGTQSNHDNKFVRVELRKTDQIVQDSKRCEIFKYLYDRPGEEHWYTFSVYLPASGDEEYLCDPEGSEIIAQWHNTPDPGEEWTSPPLALRTYDNSWYIERFWDANALSTTDRMKALGQYENVNIGSYINDKGKWTDWIVHIKWGWLPEHHTILEVYKNGELVFERNGLPNTTNDRVGIRQKLGIYKWDWAQPNYGGSIVSKRVVYFYDGSMLNNQYAQVITKLSNLHIIHSPDYWNQMMISHFNANGEFMADIMLKISGKKSLESAVDYFASAGIINSPDYWLHNCKAGHEVNAIYAEKLIIDIGNTLLL